MELLSNARSSTLPIRRFPGDQHRHPRVDEMVDYLKVAEAAIGVETVWGVRATRVERRGSGSTMHLSTTAGDVGTRNIVCATGSAARPSLPVWVPSLNVPGVVLHSESYQYPRQIPTQDVLIVGGGNSGVQIARELAASHSVTLAVRTPRTSRSIASYPLMAGQRNLWFGRSPRPEPLFGDHYEQLRRAGVRIVSAVTDAHSDTVTLADGAHAAPGSVILATGYLRATTGYRMRRAPRRRAARRPGSPACSSQEFPSTAAAASTRSPVCGPTQSASPGGSSIVPNRRSRKKTIDDAHQRILWTHRCCTHAPLIFRSASSTTYSVLSHSPTQESTPLMRKPRRYAIALLATVLLGAGITLASGGPAQAHDSLPGSHLDADSPLAVSPDEVSLSFSGVIISDMQSAVVEASAETTTNTGGSEPFGGVALLPILAVLTGVIILGAGFIVVFKVTRERRLRNEEAVDRQEQQDSERTSKDASHEK
tara:strand:+ start:1996 stop:3438 length:1443 start_codon:yes stop_codon:yes gene_type:complete